MSQFTNRHGKKVNIKDDEIIVNPSTQMPINAPPDKATPLPKRRLRLPKVRISKRLSITLVVMLVIVAVAALVTADSIKRDYESQTAAMKRTIVDRGKQSTSTETSSVDAIKNLRASLNARHDCKVKGLDVVSWYGPAKVARQDCQATADRYTKLQLALDDMVAMAVYTTAMNEVLKDPLAAPSSGEYAVISDYVTSWEEATAALDKLTAPEILSSQHQGLVTKVKSVSDAWAALSKANSDRNTEEFKKAEASLNDKYSELRTASDGIQMIVMSTQTSITRYVSELSSQ